MQRFGSGQPVVLPGSLAQKKALSALAVGTSLVKVFPDSVSKCQKDLGHSRRNEGERIRLDDGSRLGFVGARRHEAVLRAFQVATPRLERLVLEEWIQEDKL